MELRLFGRWMPVAIMVMTFSVAGIADVSNAGYGTEGADRAPSLITAGVSEFFEGLNRTIQGALGNDSDGQASKTHTADEPQAPAPANSRH